MLQHHLAGGSGPDNLFPMGAPAQLTFQKVKGGHVGSRNMRIVAGEGLVLDGGPPFGERLDAPWFGVLPYIQPDEEDFLRVSVFRPHVGISREFLAGQPVEASSFAINPHFTEELGIRFL